MPAFDRRSFLGSLATAVAAGPVLLGQDKAKDKDKDDAENLGFAPDTLFLTWQRDPTTTMTVQWVGSEWEAADKTVSVAQYHTAAPAAPAAAQPWTAVKPAVKPFPMTDLKVFRAEFTGLTPGTEYQFKIGKKSPTWRFRTMPAKATDTFTFVSGGDCGVNHHAAANNAAAAAQDPYFVLIDGDLGYDNGRDPVVALGFIRNYSKHTVDTKGRLVPLVAGIGNHEVNGAYGKTMKEATFFAPLFDGLYKDTSYAVLDIGDYLSLVLLDSGHAAPIGGEQADWLEKTLKARAGVPHLIAANHVPAYPSYRPVEVEGGEAKAGTGEENRKHWVPLFEKYGVDVVLEHHDHTFKRTHPLLGGHVDKNGVVYLGDGSWGKLRVPKTPQQRPYLAKSAAAYHLTLHRLEADQRFHLAMEEPGKVADVCVTGKRTRGQVRAGA